MNLRTPVHQLDDRHRGWTCPACQGRLLPGDMVCECTACGGPQHLACWERESGCMSYQCRPERSAQVGSSPQIVITSKDVNDVHVETVRTPAGLGEGEVRIATYAPRRYSKLAVASFIVALAGIPLVGLVTGVVAVVLAGIALAAVHTDRRLKGMGFALAAIFIGLFDIVGWIALLTFGPWNRPRQPEVSFVQTEAVALENAPPIIRGALKSSVYVTGEQSAGIMGKQKWMGSGVILQKEGNCLTILTNRHVADPDYAEGKADTSLEELSRNTLKIGFASGTTADAKVEWLAPNGLDIALLTVQTGGEDACVAKYDLERKLYIGDRVFAIGSPQGFAWTYTEGLVSGFRKQLLGAHEAKVIQTQTPINAGNSGGGLFDAAGYLVGINTWASAKGVSEGLNFAISIETIDGVLKEAGRLPR